MAAGDWDALTLSATTLKGIVPVDFLDSDYEEFDTDKVTDDYLLAAKRYIETRLIKDLPEMIVRSDGPAEFMDAATTISNVARLIQEMLAWSFLLHWYGQESFSSIDKYAFSEERARNRFEEAFTAFARYIPADEDFFDALEATSSSDLGKFRHIVFVG